MYTVLQAVYIFGAGHVGRDFLPRIKQKFSVIAFLDNDKSKWGSSIDGIPVCAPESVLEIDGADFDLIIVASLAGINDIKNQLSELGVDSSKISTEYVDYPVKSRNVFLLNLSRLFQAQGVSGCVAECGVFLGEFAKEINTVFPDKKFYLFDTFSGFDARDVQMEKKMHYSNLDAGHFNITNEEIVRSKLPHPEMAIIRKGYFPETIEGIDEEFCFVNLDFDLYMPTLAGLEYFSARMVKGGVILVHDYFAAGFKGIKAAVADFAAKSGAQYLPIGDGLSVAIQF